MSIGGAKMKLRINHIWNDLKNVDEIDLISHSINNGPRSIRLKKFIG